MRGQEEAAGNVSTFHPAVSVCDVRGGGQICTATNQRHFCHVSSPSTKGVHLSNKSPDLQATDYVKGGFHISIAHY